MPSSPAASVSTKTDAGTGGVLETESYAHDANSNVIEQTVDDTTTTYTYDRNRLVSATANGVTAGYNYDPYGRLLAVKSGGKVIESRSYDGFGRTFEHTKLGDAGDTVTSTYAYDPLDRTTTKTTGAGTASEETTEFDYLGLSNKVIAEEIGGQVQRSYTYSAWGQRLSMLKHDTDGTGPETSERSYHGYNPHTDVETLTTKTGETRATYGYTAYGSNDTEAFTGIDTPQPDQPGVEEPYNPYRFNHKRFDAASGSYDMGFRNYSPGLNRFTERDLYLGARANMGLTTDGFTGNRYAFTAGNPISRIELDGHCFMDANGVCDSPKNSGSTNDVDSYTLDNGTTLTQTPDGQSYINGYKLPSGGQSAVSLARAIDEFTPLIRDVQAMGPGPLDPSETAGAIAIFCDQEDEQDLCGNEWAFKVHAKQVAKELPEALAASAGGLRGGAVSAAAIASVGKIIRGFVRSGVVAPQTIKFSQSSVSATMRNGASIDDLAGALRSGTIKASSIPPVRLVKKGGHLYTLDNRRLVAFQKAGVPIPFRMVTSREIRNEVGKKFTSATGGTSIKIRGSGRWSP